MHDVKNVVDGLHRVRDYLDVQKHTFDAAFPNEKTDCFDDALSVIDSAIDMLKEQEPKPPIIKENSYGWKFYYCPSCGKEFYQNNKFSFCEKCGQEVKWE